MARPRNHDRQVFVRIVPRVIFPWQGSDGRAGWGQLNRARQGNHALPSFVGVLGCGVQAAPRCMHQREPVTDAGRHGPAATIRCGRARTCSIFIALARHAVASARLTLVRHRHSRHWRLGHIARPHAPRRGLGPDQCVNGRNKHGHRRAVPQGMPASGLPQFGAAPLHDLSQLHIQRPGAVKSFLRPTARWGAAKQKPCQALEVSPGQ